MKYRHAAIFIVIILLASFFRFTGVNWDNSQMLHPDERFLTMVSAAMILPDTPAEFYNQSESKMNPKNIGYQFFVYGTFPLVLNKYIATWSKNDFYSAIGVNGRIVSAAFDLLALLFVFKLAQLLEKHRGFHTSIKYAAAFIYAGSVLSIQLSHFFTVDTFLNTLVLGAVYFSLRFFYTRTWYDLLCSASMFALALACKVSAVYVAPVIAIYLSFAWVFAARKSQKHPDLKKEFLAIGALFKKKEMYSKRLPMILATGLVFAGVSYLLLRVANPFYFAESSFFKPALDPAFDANIEQLKSFNDPNGYFPPSIQWIDTTPVLFSLKNMVLFGMGVPFAVFFLAGIGVVLKQKEYRAPELLVLLVWMGVYFLYQSTQFVKVMRYFIILYPLMALFAGIGLWYVIQRRRYLVQVACFVLLLIWPLMFMNIYMQPHSRIQATQWIYENISPTEYILTEHWDDPLPLILPENPGFYTGEQLEVFYPDSPDKFAKIYTQMQNADYYILTSNRAWGSISRVPDKYPEMSQFYTDLFEGKKGYEIIKEFTVYPSLSWMGIPVTFPDQWSDESFTVYDHPKVIIMKNTAK